MFARAEPHLARIQPRLNHPARAGHPQSGYDFPYTRAGRVGIGRPGSASPYPGFSVHIGPPHPELDPHNCVCLLRPGFQALFDMVGETSWGWGLGVGGWTQLGLGIAHNAGL